MISELENLMLTITLAKIIARNRIMISDLENWMLTITLAKIKIINPTILDCEDISKVIVMGSTNTSITDLVEVSYIKVLLDNKFLHFFIKYPIP